MSLDEFKLTLAEVIADFGWLTIMASIKDGVIRSSIINQQTSLSSLPTSEIIMKTTVRSIQLFDPFNFTE